MAIPLVLAGCNPVGGTTAGEDLERRVLPVEVVEVERASGYAAVSRYIGRVEAARSSDLGFELAGVVTEVLVNEGDAVAVGDVLARLDTARLTARQRESEALLNEAEASLTLADAMLDRHAKLIETAAVSQTSYDEALRNRLAASAVVERTRAALAAVEIDLSKSEIRAPFAGEIGHRFVDEGSVVAPSAPVVRLVESGELEIRVGLGAGAAASIEVGSALVLESGEPATVARILPTRGSEARTVDVILESDAPGLRDGDLVGVPIERPIGADGFWLPRTALTEGARGLWACYAVAGEDPGDRVAERRDLEILHLADGRAYVRGAVAHGEPVVSGGLHRLVAGQHVAITDR